MPPKRQKRSHVPSTVDGHLEQLMPDVTGLRRPGSISTHTFDQKKSKYFVIINTSKSNIVHEDPCHSILLQTLNVYM